MTIPGSVLSSGGGLVSPTHGGSLLFGPTFRRMACLLLEKVTKCSYARDL